MLSHIWFSNGGYPNNIMSPCDSDKLMLMPAQALCCVDEIHMIFKDIGPLMESCVFLICLPSLLFLTLFLLFQNFGPNLLLHSSYDFIITIQCMFLCVRPVYKPIWSLLSRLIKEQHLSFTIKPWTNGHREAEWKRGEGVRGVAHFKDDMKW